MKEKEKEKEKKKKKKDKRKTKEIKEKSCVSYPEGNQQDSPREGPAQESP